MNKGLKRVFFWITFLIGCFFLWWSSETLRASSAMIAFATGMIFLLVSCSVILLDNVIFKSSTSEVSPSLPFVQPQALLSYEKKVTEAGVLLSHRDMTNGGGSLFDRDSPNSDLLEEIFGGTDKDDVDLDNLISTWNNLDLSLEKKG